MDSAATVVRPADAAAIARAGEIVRAGGLVAFPTETVYGLGADASNDRAVAAIFAAKNRPQINPLIVHVPDAEKAERLAVFSPLAHRLAQTFWPGALSLVLPRRAEAKLSLLVGAGLDTVALRIPSSDVAHKLLSAAGMPIAAPSANVSGRISATTAAHVAEELNGKIGMVLDGGAAALGIESTVIGFDGDRAVLLRPGAIAREAIEKLTGPLAAPEGTCAPNASRASSGSTSRALRRNDACGA